MKSISELIEQLRETGVKMIAVYSEISEVRVPCSVASSEYT